MGTFKADKGAGLVTVETTNLQDKLNRAYDVRRFSQSSYSDSGLFDYLWEIKERALMEKLDQVQVPNSWLEELEDSVAATKGSWGRTH